MNAPTNAIFERYYNALIADWDDEHAVIGAARLALRLAIADAAALAQPAPQPTTPTADQRVAESAVNQIGRLNEWLVNEEPALSSDNNLDTAAAVLKAIRCRDHDLVMAYRDLQAAIGDADQLRQQLAQLDADNAGLIAEVDRLTRLNSIAVSAVNQQITNGAAPMGHVSNGANAGAATWWANLDDETNDWRISLDAGWRTFRQLSRRTRLLLGRAVALHIGNGQMPKQADFDAGRPAWMPTATSLCGTFGCTWYELPDLDPATVAP